MKKALKMNCSVSELLQIITLILAHCQLDFIRASQLQFQLAKSRMCLLKTMACAKKIISVDRKVFKINILRTF